MNRLFPGVALAAALLLAPPAHGFATAASSPHTCRADSTAHCAAPAAATAEPDAPDAVAPGNWALLSERGRAAVARLATYDADAGSQRHVYADWPGAGEEDDGKRALAEQVRPAGPGPTRGAWSRRSMVLRVRRPRGDLLSEEQDSIQDGDEVVAGAASTADEVTL